MAAEFPAEFLARWHGLAALQNYLIECVDSESGVKVDELYALLVDSAKLVRDYGGDVELYIDGVCAALPVADVEIKRQLRDELWTKLSS